MIDICMIIYRNYYLLDKQIEHWHNYMKGDFRLLLVDNTPAAEYQYREYQGKPVQRFFPSNSFDGISSGEAYDFILSQATSDIVGLTDPDNFWFNPYILSDVEEYFNQGYKCVGDQGFYPDWQRIIDTGFPDFAGHLAPVLWGMFIDRKLALEDTWVCEPPGVGKITGWRTRKKIIDNKIPNIVFPGFFPNPDDNQVCFFGPEDMPIGVHFLKGCSSRAHIMPSIVPHYLELGKSKWS